MVAFPHSAGSCTRTSRPTCHDLLVKIDRCTMANSLESALAVSRSPVDRIRRVAADRYSSPAAARRRSSARRSPIWCQRTSAAAARWALAYRLGAGSGPPADFMRDGAAAPDARTARCCRVVSWSGWWSASAGDANLGHQLWSLICFERWLQMFPTGPGHLERLMPPGCRRAATAAATAQTAAARNRIRCTENLPGYAERAPRWIRPPPRRRRGPRLPVTAGTAGRRRYSLSPRPRRQYRERVHVETAADRSP